MSRLTVTPESIEAYLRELTPPRDAALSGLEEDARANKIPIVGPLVGRFLHGMARSVGARRIFELGSATGYSTVWLARALPEGGEIHYTEWDRKRADTARRAFEQAGVAAKVRAHVGDALESLAKTPGTFDLVFNDLDKNFYPAALEAGVPRLRPGGVWISDNALWDGEVVSAPPRDEWTESIRRHNTAAYARPDLFCSLIPLRDGLLVGWKS
ncbi:MAG: O-methyltransferase [Planctomycetes bacterium]|nr:O-methyltransferase [Planctomycetota bacterium]